MDYDGYGIVLFPLFVCFFISFLVTALLAPLVVGPTRRFLGMTDRYWKFLFGIPATIILYFVVWMLLSYLGALLLAFLLEGA